MPFRLTIELIKNLVIIIDTQIKKEHTINKKVRIENDIYYDNLIKLNDRLLFINSKLKLYQELSPTIEEIPDLKFRREELYNKLHNINDILGPIDKKHSEIIKKRDEHYYKWYLCLFCINRYKKLNFIEDLKDLNKKILTRIDLLNSEFNDLTILMSDYEKQIQNLKFNFLPLRRLWISNKWDKDANQNSQRVTIFTFSQEIQSKDSKDSNYKLHGIHYENMNKFLNNMIVADKTGKQLDAIGLGRACGTYFLDSSLIASLTNLPSEKLEWKTLSDMVLYFSLLPITRPTDDKITPDITNRYNKEYKHLELCDTNEDYKKHFKDVHINRQRNLLVYMKELQERQEADYRLLLKQLKSSAYIGNNNAQKIVDNTSIEPAVNTTPEPVVNIAPEIAVNTAPEPTVNTPIEQIVSAVIKQQSNNLPLKRRANNLSQKQSTNNVSPKQIDNNAPQPISESIVKHTIQRKKYKKCNKKSD